MNVDDKFLDRVMRLWSRGWNTVEIAKKLGRHESVVEWALHAGLEARRASAIDTWQKLGDVAERVTDRLAGDV